MARKQTSLGKDTAFKRRNVFGALISLDGAQRKESGLGLGEGSKGTLSSYSIISQWGRRLSRNSSHPQLGKHWLIGSYTIKLYFT